MLALYWGSTATIGPGAIVGVIFSQVAHAGSDAPLPARRLVRSVSLLIALMALSAVAAGVCGYVLAERGVITVPTPFAESIPHERHDHFMAAWFAHGASYLVGLAGSACLNFSVWRARGRPVVFTLLPQTRSGALRTVIIAIIAVCVLWIRFRAR
jgi:hypothetical protein